jgi:ligand-binding sensor domain-containing protein
MFFKKIIGLLLFICNGPFLFSQFTVYDMSNSPLPDNNVYALAVDGNGNKWIGTDLGLAVFDNTNWTVYTTSNSGLPNNSVRAIAFDSAGNAWIGTYFGGLAKFDGSTWTVYTTSNSGLPSDFVKCIDLDSMNNVWVGTDFGFAKFNGSSWTLWNTTNSSFVSDNIAAIRINRKTDVKYIGTVNGGYAELDPSNAITHYYISNSNLIDNTTWSIALDTNGYQWLGFPADGAMLHITANIFQLYQTFNSNIPSNTVYDVIVDPLNREYMATLAGLTRFDGTSWVTWDTTNSNIPENFVRRVVKENDGTIWVGTINGLAKMVDGVGMGEEMNPVVFDIYPNPGDGNFTVRMNDTDPGYEVFVFDIAGKQLFQLSVNQTMIHLALNLKPGMYLLQIGGSTKKLVIR